MADNDFMMLSEEEMALLRETFYEQALEMIENLTGEVLALESGKDRTAAIKNIKRFFHTLKGDSATIGLTDVAGVVHKMEDLMGEFEESSAEITSDLPDLILKVVDEITAAIKAHRKGKEYTISKAVKDKIAEFAIEAGGAPAASEELTEYEEELAANAIAEGKTLYRVKFTFAKECLMKSAGALILSQHLPTGGDVIRMEPPIDSPEVESSDSLTAIIASYEESGDLRGLYLIPGVIGDVAVEGYKMDKLSESAEEAMAEAGPAGMGPEGGAGGPMEALQSIRVMSDKIDQIMDLVGELVMGRSMVGQLVSDFEARYPKDDLVGSFTSATAFIERSLSDLQRSVMSIRMVPIDRVFKKFPRMVRDLCRANNKKINLVLKGEHTEIDKALVDVVGEPLLHLIRNSVDHGIEAPSDREKAGKKRTGTIKVDAYHQGNDIVIEVSDDGNGIDTEKIKAKALEKGVITKDDARRMDRREALGLIFIAGFSTASTVSDVSGRGIGMDIVKNVVEEMRGTIGVRSDPGEGSVFTLRFPLTLAIIKAIIFESGERLYALPVGSIAEIARVSHGDLDSVAGRKTLRYRDRVLPLVGMDGIAGESPRQYGKDENIFVLVLSHGEREIGMVVDKLIGEEELVVKAVDESWIKTDMVVGASILGDGKVILILNVASVVSRGLKGSGERVYGKLVN
ncbi:MAG: chemotaxis protein CheA [Thermodesulfobacteriota bacterium]